MKESAVAISLLLLAKGRAFEPQLAHSQTRYGYGSSPGQRLLSGGLALGIAGGVGAALIAALAIPNLIEPEPTIINGTHIPMPTPDPIVEPPVETTAEPVVTQLTIPRPRVILPPVGNPPVGEPTNELILPPIGSVIGTGTGGVGEVIVRDPPPPPHTPIFRDASRDPRFARSFQPAYPPALEREGITGTARVRVRIGADGRVISVENLSATDPAFFAATERQALRHWRFRPATRDGVAVESEQVLTVRFEVPPRD
jgi:periplasmic protein TonB